MAEERVNIGWIGAGKMGFPMCQRLVAAGFPVVALGRSPAACERLIAAGIAGAPTIAAVAAAADVVFAAISDDRALIDVVAGKDGVADSARPGSIFADTSTVSPEASAEVAELLDRRGILYLRSPVSGSTTTAAAGMLTAVVSGPRAAYDRLAPVYAPFARKTFHVGEGEEARHLKLVLNGLVGATSAILGEVLALGRKGGLDNATMLEVITQSAVASPLIGYKRDMIVAGTYEAAFDLAQMMKDFDILLAVAREAHCPVPLTAQIRQTYEAAFARGLGEKDFFVLVHEAARRAALEG